MKVVRNWNELANYIIRLGLLPDTNIAWRQEILVQYTDKIEKVAGKYPFRIHYYRKESRFEVRPGLKGKEKFIV